MFQAETECLAFRSPSSYSFPRLRGENALGFSRKRRISKRKNHLCSQNSSQGFSILEILLVVFFIGVLAAIAIPNLNAALANIRLRGAAGDLSGLMQQARLISAKKNKTLTVRFDLPNTNGAYVDLNGGGAGPYATGDPMIQFAGAVKQVSPPAGFQGAPVNLDATGGPLGWSATSGNISFNSRGLPCSSSSTVCLTNVNFVFYFSDGSRWIAVSVTAAGRATVWSWNGSAWTN